MDSKYTSKLERVGGIINSIVVSFTLLALCLKLTGVVGWSWWTVFSLFILDLLLCFVLFVGTVAFVIVTRKKN